MSQFVGMKYEALAVLGSQVVNGTNYRILCYAKNLKLGDEDGGFFTIVTVYAPLEGTATVKEVTNFD